MKLIAIVLFSMMLGVCFAEDCPCTREYRPVCASNGITYANRCLFECAKRSDVVLRIVREGACKEYFWIPNRSDCICPDVYAPICTNLGLFGNKCHLNCFLMNNPGINIIILNNGPCPVKE